MRFAVALLGVALLAADESPSFYLPDSVKPVEYSLDLRIDPRRPDFAGVVRIDVDVREQVSTIWLNSSVRVWRALVDGHAVRAAEPVNGQFLALRTASPVPPGRHSIEISYNASFQEQPVGAYRRRAGDDWYVYTTFTAIEARRAIPCFDEPRFKTPWRVSIAAPEAMTAVANAPAASERAEKPGWRRTTFRATAPLPSEVVAFAVGPFDVLDGGVAGRKRTPVRVITVRGRAAEGKAAAESTAPVLEALENYTGMAYPWDKLDHIAILDGAYGAVENPGLITYRDRSLLRPESERARAGVRGLMAHELAHQWFGNLVTQANWDDVWLSEGFAQFLGMKIADLDRPADRRGFQRVLAKQTMMAHDRGPQARPVRKPMRAYADMADVYSRTVYVKGASALAELEQLLGEQPMQRGLRRYLAGRRFGIATTGDLIGDLRTETGVDTRPVLLPLLDGIGAPELRIDACGSADRPKPMCVGGASWTFGDAGGAGYYWIRPPSTGSVDVRRLTAPERTSLILRTMAELPFL